MLAVLRRELKAYFVSPIGFTFVGFFILITGVFFALSNLLSGNPAYTGMLSSLTFIFLFLVPILTMRLLSDEMRQKTDQLLITSPLSITGIVLGKYLAAVAVFLITLLITALYPILLSFFAIGGIAGLGNPGRLYRLLPPGLLLHRGRALLLLPHGQSARGRHDHLRRAAADLDTGYHRAEHSH